MVNIVANLIKLQEQIRILHWQTKIFSRHKAYSKAYDELGVLIDELVEVYQGKNNRLEFKQLTIDVTDIDVCKITDILDESVNMLTIEMTALLNATKDTDLLNIRDSILSFINRFKYLLTLK